MTNATTAAPEEPSGKATKKRPRRLIGISVLSVIVVGLFAVGTWAFNSPKDALQLADVHDKTSSNPGKLIAQAVHAVNPIGTAHATNPKSGDVPVSEEQIKTVLKKLLKDGPKLEAGKESQTFDVTPNHAISLDYLGMNKKFLIAPNLDDPNAEMKAFEKSVLEMVENSGRVNVALKKKHKTAPKAWYNDQVSAFEKAKAELGIVPDIHETNVAETKAVKTLQAENKALKEMNALNEKRMAEIEGRVNGQMLINHGISGFDFQVHVDMQAQTVNVFDTVTKKKNPFRYLYDRHAFFFANAHQASRVMAVVTERDRHLCVWMMDLMTVWPKGTNTTLQLEVKTNTATKCGLGQRGVIEFLVNNTKMTNDQIVKLLKGGNANKKEG